jgi:hypothetical protein
MTSLSGNIAFIQYHASAQDRSPRSDARREADAHLYNQIVALPRRQLGVWMKLVAAAYVLALAVLPFAHHDLACHLKSTTHCWTCHVGTSADESRPDPAAAPTCLSDAGRADDAPRTLFASQAPSPSSGRSPPRLLAVA